ncbi:hypothetical protein AYO41_02040 [Verrucomicrobia bacterium SCGC AG-212-E04]|nr:hypothetical protein AYO41_02040 [Verrucomicrobia bacterium SCGC AG-212-E04]
MEAITTTSLLKLGDIYLNLNLVTHVVFEGHGASVYLACQVTDGDGHNGVQPVITFEGPEAHELRWHLQQRASVKPE